MFDCSFSWPATLIASYCSYISFSLCPSRQTRSIAPGRKKCDREGATRVVNVAERSRRVGRTVLHAGDGWRKRKQYTSTCHRIPSAPTQRSCGRQPVRYRLLLDRNTRYSVPRRSASRIDNTCNSKRLAHAHGNTSSG